MKWHNKIGIGELSLAFFALFLYVGFKNDIEELHWAHVFFIFAEAALSVWITLEVIEFAIKKERIRKWQRVKKLTYITILNNLRNIANDATSFAFLVIGDPENQHLSDNAIALASDGNKPRKEVPIAMIHVAEIINTYHKKNREERDKLDGEKMVKLLIDYYTKEHWRLNDIILTLSPRILEISDDEDVNLSLLRFENASRIFEDMMELQQGSELKKVPVATYALVILLKEAGKLYDVLLRGMITVSEKSLIQGLVNALEHWWLPFDY